MVLVLKLPSTGRELKNICDHTVCWAEAVQNYPIKPV